MGRGGSIGVPSHVKTHPSLSHLSTAARNGLFRSNFTGSNFTGSSGKPPGLETPSQVQREFEHLARCCPGHPEAEGREIEEEGP